MNPEFARRMMSKRFAFTKCLAWLSENVWLWGDDKEEYYTDYSLDESSSESESDEDTLTFVSEEES